LVYIYGTSEKRHWNFSQSVNFATQLELWLTIQYVKNDGYWIWSRLS
jgi:hypothetical protein